MAEKFFSIITVHLDDFSGLQDTFQSVVQNPGRDQIEWIVIDGGSKPQNEQHEKTLSLVAREADVFISEPDDGIYDAMNKGVKSAQGEYFLFLNAGDRLDGQFDLPRFVSALKESDFDMVWGKTSMQYPDGSYGVKKVRRPGWAWYGMPVCHQSVVFSRKAFGHKIYDTSLLVAADYDLICAALVRGSKVHLFKDVISIHVAGGRSQQDKHLSLNEEHKVRSRYYGIPSWLSKLISVFRLQMWKLSDASPGFNRLWRRWV